MPSWSVRWAGSWGTNRAGWPASTRLVRILIAPEFYKLLLVLTATINAQLWFRSERYIYFLLFLVVPYSTCSFRSLLRHPREEGCRSHRQRLPRQDPLGSRVDKSRACAPGYPSPTVLKPWKCPEFFFVGFSFILCRGSREKPCQKTEWKKRRIPPG